jgi:hypothetical protein
MRRLLALLILVLGLAPGIYLREGPVQRGGQLDLQIVRLDAPDKVEYSRHLGPFELEAIWQMTSPLPAFGGFSSLLPPAGGKLTAISDKGWRLRFALQDRFGGGPHFRPTFLAKKMQPFFNDVEAATSDPLSGNIWLAIEGRNAIARFGPGMRFEGLTMPASIRDWGLNTAAESMVRLRDGRFVLLREGFSGWFETREHAAIIFDSDPVEGATARPFKVSGPAGFSPTDAAQLPDGRLLVLMRRVVWPFPARFAGRLAIGDPRHIKEGKVWRLHDVARLTSTLPVDNFEGLAIDQRSDGRLNVWLISDDNSSELQRSLLWKLIVDPADLPGSHSHARRDAARLSASSN